MSSEFEQRYEEWLKWYKEHWNDSSGLENKVKFLEKMLEGSMELHAYAMRDIRELESRSRSEMLYTPRSLVVRP